MKKSISGYPRHISRIQTYTIIPAKCLKFLVFAPPGGEKAKAEAGRMAPNGQRPAGDRRGYTDISLNFNYPDNTGRRTFAD